MLLGFQEGDIHDIALLYLLDGDPVAVFIVQLSGAVHGQRVVPAKLQVEESHCAVLLVPVHQHCRVRRVVAFRPGDNEARVHPGRLAGGSVSLPVF